MVEKFGAYIAFSEKFWCIIPDLQDLRYEDVILVSRGISWSEFVTINAQKIL